MKLACVVVVVADTDYLIQLQSLYYTYASPLRDVVGLPEMEMYGYAQLSVIIT